MCKALGLIPKHHERKRKKGEGERNGRREKGRLGEKGERKYFDYVTELCASKCLWSSDYFFTLMKEISLTNKSQFKILYFGTHVF
jgi:hypothetical protein